MSETGQNPIIRQPLTPARQPVATGRRASLTGVRFYTGCTQRIPQRSRLRRGFVPRSPVWCHPRSNDFKRFDRRGELLLRVVLLGRARGVWDRFRAAGFDRARGSGDHPGIDPARHRHSSDGESSAAKQGRGVSRVSGARVAVHSTAAEAHAPERVRHRRILRWYPPIFRDADWIPGTGQDTCSSGSCANSALMSSNGIGMSPPSITY
jgi:hypothetical protein